VEIIEHEGVRMTIWDLGGQEKIRECWKKYFLQAHGLIFVVDSSDSQRFDVAKNELQKILNNPDIHEGVPLLVFANKQDSPLACNPAQMADMLDLSRTQLNRPKSVQPADAISGRGLKEGLTWLTNQFKASAKNA